MGMWYKPPSTSEEFEWEENGSLLTHLQFLINVREYIAHSDPPEGYCQFSHSDAPIVGDRTKPAILDASYRHRARNLISTSMPAFVPSQPWKNPGPDGEINTGFSHMTYAGSMYELFSAYGINRTAPEKIGHDHFSQTVYFEFDVTDEDYEKGRRIIDTYIRSRKTDAVKLFHEIQRDLRKHGFDTPDVPREAMGLTQVFLVNTSSGLRVLGEKCGIFSAAVEGDALDVTQDPKAGGSETTHADSSLDSEGNNFG